MLEGIGLFRGIMAKMNWLDQNQQVLAKNVANSDTPGFQPMTLKKADFESFLGQSLKQNSTAPIKMMATKAEHFGSVEQNGAAMADAKGVKQKKIYEASPDNNGVVLEEQMFKANANSMQFQIVTDLYRRNTGMMRAVIQGSRG